MWQKLADGALVLKHMTQVHADEATARMSPHVPHSVAASGQELPHRRQVHPPAPVPPAFARAAAIAAATGGIPATATDVSRSPMPAGNARGRPPVLVVRLMARRNRGGPGALLTRLKALSD